MSSVGRKGSRARPKSDPSRNRMNSSSSTRDTRISSTRRRYSGSTNNSSSGSTPVPSERIKFKTCIRSLILNTFKERGFVEVEEDDWDIIWANIEWMRENYESTPLIGYRKLNHFKRSFELTRKDLLAKNLKKYRRTLRKNGIVMPTFFPSTYVLPADYSLFVEEFKRTPGGVWIMKPIGRAQGKGIFLFEKLRDIEQWKSQSTEEHRVENYVVQMYLDHPYLVGGKKFDLRLYVLVVSYRPLVVYIYREGFARFSFTPYSMDDIDNAYVHLTNVSLQKGSSNYDESIGAKWGLDSLRRYLNAKHSIEETDILFAQMQQLVLLSLKSVQNSVIHDPHCFELYGYDILIDGDMNPWLIEVNASPSLSAETQSDKEMKMRLLHDMLSVVDMERRLYLPSMLKTRRHPLRHDPALRQVGSFDLVCDGEDVQPEVFASLHGHDPISVDPLPLFHSTFGCNIDTTNIKRLEKQAAEARKSDTPVPKTVSAKNSKKKRRPPSTRRRKS
ncbi:hypothetical protein PCE1_000278 [Barthelona sp. PCE]